MRPKIVRLPEGFALHTNYNEDFKDELKKLVPARARRWEDVEERWIVLEDRSDFEDKVAQLCVAHFGSVEVYGEDGDSDYVIDRQGRAVQERLL